MIPVFVKVPGTETPPEGDLYYIIARNGIFLKKKTNWVDAIIPVKQISVLDAQEITATLLLKPIPEEVMAKVIKFFRKVYKKHYSEAVVEFLYHEELGWDISVPLQKVDSGSAQYTSSVEWRPGYVRAGTAHSHGSMSAFHSGIDVPDEADRDGIHITVGYLNRPDTVSLDAEAVVNGMRIPLSATWIQGVQEYKKEEEEKEGSRWFSRRSEKNLYTISDNTVKDWDVPEEWMKKVAKKEYFYERYTGATHAGVDSKNAASNEKEKETDGAEAEGEKEGVYKKKRTHPRTYQEQQRQKWEEEEERRIRNIIPPRKRPYDGMEAIRGLLYNALSEIFK